ncbi:MAG: MBL fold metallo-hydrolase [Eubacterium sp.]
MKIVKLVVGPMASNCYIVWDEDTKDAVIIDPGFDDHRIMETVEKHDLKVGKIVLTHGHFDHIGGLKSVREATGAPVYIYADDADTLTSAGKNLSTMIGSSLVLAPAEVLLHEGDRIEIAPNLELVTVHTPGHTVGSCCFVGDDVIFSGDTLFQGSIGRTDFPGGDMTQMMESLNKLMTYDPDMAVLPGHGENTDIAYEKARNPFIARG